MIAPEHASHIRDVNVGFVLLGLDLNPAKINECLGIASSLSARKGDARVSPKGQRLGVHRQGWWRLDSTPLLTVSGDARKDINEHFSVLIDLLLPKRRAISEIASEGEVFFDVMWASTYLKAGTGPLISAQNLRGIADLGASLGFDIYQIDEREEQSAGSSDGMDCPSDESSKLSL